SQKGPGRLQRRSRSRGAPRRGAALPRDPGVRPQGHEAIRAPSSGRSLAVRRTGRAAGGGRSPRGEGGYSLVALVASVTIMLILMTAAVPSWKYVMKNDREEELLYRGGEIADAIVRFQKKNANAYPTSLDQLVKGKFLRRLYKEPMSKDGKWRLIHQGQAVAPTTTPGGPSPTDKSTPTTTTPPTTTPSDGNASGGLGSSG